MSKSIGYPKRGRKRFNQEKRLMKGKNTKKDLEQNRQIIKIEKKLKKLDKEPELKWTDEYNASFVVPNTGLVYNILTPGPVQGVGPNNRIGNQINMTSLMTKILLLSNASSLDPTRYRVLIVIDKEFEIGNPQLGGAPTSSAILDNSVVTDLTLSPRNFNNIKRYKIVYDKVFIQNPQTLLDYDPVTGNTTLYTRMSKYLTIHLKMKHRLQFLGPTNTIAELTGTVPLLYIVSDRTGVAGAGEPLATVAQRIYYKDC